MTPGVHYDIALPGTGWMDQAACAELDGDLFFPPVGGSLDPAVLKVCKRCPVQTECLEYALAHRHDGGVWGGAGETERRRMLRERRA